MSKALSLSRRSFLKASAITAAAVSIASTGVAQAFAESYPGAIDTGEFVEAVGASARHAVVAASSNAVCS